MANKKEFTEEQKQQIIQMRADGKSCDTIGHFIQCGKDRVRRFCKANNIPVGQNARQKNPNPMKSIAEVHEIDTPYPDFSLAACRGKNIATFYPLPASGGTAKLNYMRVVSDAVKICSECPIQGKCLDYALLAEPYGIWGGTTEEERQFLRMKLNIVCERDCSSSARMVRRHLGTSVFQSMAKSKYEFSPIVKARLTQRA